MTQLKAILIDDELPSLQNLEQKIIEFCPDIKIIATEQKPESAITLIEQSRPDVIFLDIEMPRMNGFKMLEHISLASFDVVFTTAYNHYAIDALRISAFDYLVKPVGVQDLQITVDRLMKSQIIHIESSSNYSKIYFKEGKTLLVTKLLKDFEEMLVPYRFYRIHNSHLINLIHIKKYIRGDGGQVVMQNNEVIDVARRKKEEFLRLIS